MADASEPDLPSRSATPNPRFTSQTHTAEDLLKEQTVGLVHLSDFRKRRAEAIEQLSRDETPVASGATTPKGRETCTKTTFGFKKRRKALKKGGLSFGDEDEDEESEQQNGDSSIIARVQALQADEAAEDSSDAAPIAKKRGLKPNSTISFQPKAMTKSALLRDAQLKESLRKEYLQLQEAVKATEFLLPFVFFDGKSTPGGSCRMKKGDFIWLFLERARKVGATSGDGSGKNSRKDWARIGVDDLIVVRGDVIIPHHYDFHYFIVNRTTGYNDSPIFTYSAEPTSSTPQHLLPNKSGTATPDPTLSGAAILKTAEQRRAEAAAAPPAIPDADLEGFHDDPALTKVVDRRWYERNKHIYPASLWAEFDHNKDYSKGGRKDGEGNAFFYSR